MKTINCLLVLLFSLAGMACEQREIRVSTAKTVRQSPVMKPMSAQEELQKSIDRASAKTRAPAEIITLHLRLESGPSVKGNSGNCLAYKEYEKRGGEKVQAKIDALKLIASANGLDWKTMRGSCGSATASGGDLGRAQAQSTTWIEIMGTKNPFVLDNAMEFIGRYHQKLYAKSKGTEYERRVQAIIRYHGGIDHVDSVPYAEKAIAAWNVIHSERVGLLAKR